MWEHALKTLREKLSSQVFDTWFRPISCDKQDENAIILRVPNKFFKDWLSNNYMEIIRESVFLAYGRHLRVELMVAPDLFTSTATELTTRHECNPKLEPRLGQSYSCQLNPRYTFANFIVGASNQLPHAASIAVTEMLGMRYNPLFIYGGVGLGKTHLIHAIGNEIKRKLPIARICYISSEQFMNDFIWSLRNDKSLRDNKMDAFRSRFRNETDVLLMDDLQFIAGKDRTQDEFFHTFNSLYEKNKQIVLASDKYPQEIPDLEERLASRFQWGLIADIHPPEFETRLAIVTKKAEDEGILIPNDVAVFLATTIKSNVRELEGALINLAAHASLENRQIDLKFAEATLTKVISMNQTSITVENVQETVCKIFNISLDQLKGSQRKRSIVFPRQVAMYLCRKVLKTSLPEIGEHFGGRDHTTALAACRKIEDMMRDDINTRGKIESLQRLLET